MNEWKRSGEYACIQNLCSSDKAYSPPRSQRTPRGYSASSPRSPRFSFLQFYPSRLTNLTASRKISVNIASVSFPVLVFWFDG